MVNRGLLRERNKRFGGFQIMNDRIFYRVSEIGELIGCSKSKAYELVANGTIPSTRIGTLLRVSRATLEAFVKKSADAERSRSRGVNDAD